ncbi:MAG: Hsp20/alpha crystallin family protein [Solobacterium sp.]|nr:Hsp20/alpha crystallin family protein [Solobacterium sp.]
MRFYPERRNVFDDLIDDVFGTPGYSTAGSGNLMKTDIREKDGMYMIDIELPGYKKEDVKLSLYNGSLTVSAEHHETSDEKDAKGNIIRQERYSGSCSRTWYVGTAVRQEDIKASYKDGILTVEVPSEKKKEAEEKKFIDIL